MFALNLGDRIRLARETKGWTQAELAKLLGTSQAAVSYIEQRRHLRKSVLNRYAKALGVEIASLMEGPIEYADNPRTQTIRKAFEVVCRDKDFGFGARSDERLSAETMLDIIRLYERYKGVHLLAADFF